MPATASGTATALKNLIVWNSAREMRRREPPCMCAICPWCAALDAMMKKDEAAMEKAAFRLWLALGSCDCGECLACLAVGGLTNQKVS